MKLKLKKSALVLAASVFLYSCATTTYPIEGGEQEVKAPSNSITLLFAGDVMAHNVNYNMKDYNLIWEDLKPDFAKADFTFANLEAPIDSTKPAESYPRFNMPVGYVQAAIDSGVNVFSLCNNHTNDRELEGIQQTIKTAKNLTEQEAKKNNKVYFSGLRETKDSEFTYNIIEKKGWKILFLPITEILNNEWGKANINYVSNTAAEREKFIKYCKKLREEHPCDLFVLSVHAYEAEYIRTVTKKQDAYYHSLLEAGVDIIWANHAHIIKDRLVEIQKDTKHAKIIMYANGNTISGQRTKPDLKAKTPDKERDNTGDGLIYEVTFVKKNGKAKPELFRTKNIFITTYITPDKNYVIKKMDQSFIDYLNSNSKKDWANYVEKRIKINETQTKEKIEWQ